MTFLRAILATYLLFLCFVPENAQAQSKRRISTHDRVILFKDRSMGAEIVAEQQRKELADRGYQPPQEPIIKSVTYLKIIPPRTSRERVERLLHGIKVDHPPEYDHFGYEIRRYMQSIAGSDVLGDKDRLIEELTNVRKAKVVMDYWREDLIREIKSLEEDLKEDEPTDVRQMFKYNRGVVKAFLLECQSWLDNNESMLEFLLEVHGMYEFDEPFFTFDETRHRMRFVTLYNAAHTSRKHINEYTPFMVMVY